MSAATRTLWERRHRRRIAACAAMALTLVATVVALDVGPAPQAAPGDGATGTVRGVAWVERDGDGVRDPDELARKGLAVSLARAADGTIAGEAQTDDDGRYSFDAVPPGTYVLVAALPEGAEPAPAPPTDGGQLDGQAANALTRDGAVVHSGLLEVTAGAVVETNAGILEPSAEDSSAPATEPEPEAEPGPSTAAPSDASSTTETTEAPTGTSPATTADDDDDTTEPSEPTTTSTICAAAEAAGTTTDTTATDTTASTTETTATDTTASTSSTTSTPETTTSAPSTAEATTSSTTSAAAAGTTIESTTSTTDPSTADTSTGSTTAPTADAPATDTSSTTTPSTADTTAALSPDATTEPEGDCPPATTTPPSAAPAATGDLLGPAAVPPATGTNAVITVMVGGDRSGTTGVTGLAGVVLRLYNGDEDEPSSPVTDAWATCTSDAAGDCSFIVPNVLPGGNRDRRFWVVQQAAPGGWFANLSLGTGTTLSPDTYRFRTGPELRAQQTYSSLTAPDFMVSTGNSNNQASGGIWQNSRTNPGTPSQCGLDVGLLIDVSGSVGNALPSLKTAAKTLVNSLTGTPSRMSMFTFSATAPASGANNANLDTLQSVSTPAGANVINGRIDGLSSAGTTNWDRGLAQIASSPNQFDIVVFITDGGPTVYGTGPTGPGSRTRFREVENGIFSANALKAKGTRIIAFGVGDGVSGAAAASNLIATSGPTQNSDFYQTTNYDQAAAALRLIALGNCRGSISVIKQVIPPTGTIADAAPAGGWTFSASTTTAGVTITPPSGPTSPGTGGINFNLGFPGGTPTAPVNITETLQDGYTVVQNGIQNATCTRLDTGAPAPGYANGASPTEFTVTGAVTYPVSCVVYNRAPSPQATLKVDKTWSVTSNGVTTNYPEGSQPPELQAALTVNGQPTPWGTTLTGLTAPSNATLAETLSPLPSGCTAPPGRVTLANGTPVSNALPYGATLAAGANTYTITNTVTCTASLSLVKEVANGSAVPNQWNLAAQLPAGAPPGAAPGPTGTTGVTAPVTPGVTYDLVETGGDPNYEQFVAENTEIPPPRTGTWSCIEVDAAGNQIPGYADGLNGGVTVGLGQRVRCTAVNRTTQLTLIKDVRNSYGGTAPPSSWTLTATPVPPVPPGVVAQTVTGSALGVTINARPGVTYTFSESAVPGYTLQSVECATPPDPGAPLESYPWVRADAQTLTLPALTFESTLNRVFCRFINVDSPAQVVVRKSLPAPGDTGTFLLSINGNGVATGGNGASNAATPAVVNAGTLVTVSEAGIPPTAITSYASTLTCDGGIAPTPTPGPPPGTSGSFTVPASALGTTITCTFTNTRLQATLRLDKAWVGPADGQAANLSITGVLGSPTGRSTNNGNAGDDTAATGPVYIGETVTLAEVFDPATGADRYSATLTCGGTPVTLTGTSGTFTVPPTPAGGTVTCTFTNTRASATMTLRKTWVDGAANDTAALTVAGTAPQAPVTATATATGAPGPETSPTVVVAPMFAGDAVALTEVLAGLGSYGTALVCDQPGLNYVPGALTGTYTAPAAPVNTICTFTNTRQRATLTLQKTWVDGAANDTAALSINGGPPPASATATATGAAGSETSPAVATATVLSGATVNLTEVLAGTGSYTSTLQCGGTPITLTGLTGSYLVPAAPTNVACMFTNTRTRATLTLQKTWVNGADGATADLSINGGPPVSAPATGVPGSYTSPNTATATVLSGATVTLSEVLGGAGAYDTTLDCGGPQITLTGLTGTYTVPAAPTNVTCTFTNERRLAQLTLRKVWVDGAANDTATLSINGGPPPATATATATGAAGSETSPDTATASVFSGSLVTLTEILGGVGSYTTTLDCGGTPITLTGPGLRGTYTLPSTPPATDVVCTFTNTRQRATLTLQKTWVDGAANDTAALSINGGPPPASATATATGAAGSETSPAVATATVLSGATVNLTEVLAGTGSYTSTLQCGGTPITLTGLTGTYTVPAAPTNVACMFTNTRTRATLTLQKTWINGADGATADLSINGGPPVSAPATGVPGSYTSPNTATAVVLSGATVTLSEVLGGVGSYDSALDCGGTPITLVSLAGTYTVPPAPANVTCTFTNTRRLAQLTLQKVWVDGAAGDTANLSIEDVPPVTATATGAAGPETSPDKATATVFSGSGVTLTEVLGGVGSYTSTLDCGGVSIPLTDLTGTYSVPSPPADVTCTFTNTRQRATLTLQKTWVDGAANDTAALTIAGTPPQAPATGTATATGAPGTETSPTVVTAPVLAGDTVQLSEVLAGTGTYGSALSCTQPGLIYTPGALAGTFTVPATPAPVTCTFTNTRTRATLTLRKTWVNGAAGDTAALTINGGPPPAAATATATGALGQETSPNVATATVLSGSQVALSEVLAGAGSYASTLDCGGTPIPVTDLTGSYTVPATPTPVTCTFTNTRNRATMVLLKTWVDGAAGDTAALTIANTPQTPATGTATASGAPGTETSPTPVIAPIFAGDTVQLSEVLAGTGTYGTALSCTQPGLTYAPGALAGTFTVPPAPTNVTCTFTNTRQRATLTLQKTWINGAAGDSANLSINGGPPVTAFSNGNVGPVTSPDRATATVLSGAMVTLTEVLGGIGSYDSVLNCGGPPIPLVGLTGTYTVPPAPADVLCTFTNTRQEATLTLQKAWVAPVAGDTADLTITGVLGADTVTATAPDPAAPPAQLRVLTGEKALLGEVLTAAIPYATDLTCVGNSGALVHAPNAPNGTLAITAADAGDTIACTFTNRAPRGTIVIVKNVEGEDGTFDFTGDWLEPPEFSITTDGGTESQTTNGVLAGTYTVTEVDPSPNYDGTGLVCNDPDGASTPAQREAVLTGTIDLDDGETVTCTFTNTQRSTIIVVKDAALQGPTPFNFTGDLGQFTLVDDGTATNTFTSQLLVPNTPRRIDETLTPGWELNPTTSACSNGATFDATGVTVTPLPGATVTCTFVNVPDPASVTVTKSVAGVEPGAAWGPFSFSITPAGPGVVTPQTVSGTGPSSASVTFAPIQPGDTYTISEEAVPGWTAGPITCVVTPPAPRSTSFGATFLVGPGDDVACSVTNTLEPGVLAITKVVSSPPAPNPDGTYTLAYDVAVSNIGFGSIAYTLTDLFAFAPGVAVTQVTTVNLTPGTILTNPSFDGAVNPIVASATLAGGVTDTYRVTVTANIAAVTGGPTAFDCTLQPGETGTGFLNRAQVNPTAEACAPIPYADVAVTKQVDQSSVMFESDSEAPARLTYTLVITNNGPDPAVNTVLTDDLPAGVTYVSAVPSVGSCTPVGTTTISCPIGTMAVGAVVTITVTGDLSSQADGTVTNTARVSAATTDPDMSNNVGVAGTSVRRQGGTIPVTGAQLGGALAIGIVLLGGGGLLVLLSRRRRRVPTA